MSNGINNLNIPTINGLQNLSLDNLDVGTIDGDLFYIDKIEASEIILDKKLTMNNNSWINTNGTTITNIELSYLDNCNSNIQTQINNFNTGNTTLQNQINTHTTQITNLQNSDTTQNTTLTTHTNQITALQNSDTTQNNSITALNYAVNGQITSITNLQTSDTSQNTRLTNIETLNTSQNTRLTNIETTNTSQDTSITTVLNRVRNMTATTALTAMSKPLNLNTDGECLKMSGNQTFIAGYNSIDSTRDWTLGSVSATNKKLIFNNDKNDSTTILTGKNASNLKGRNDLNLHANGILLYRGWVDAGNTQEYSGGIGQLNPNLSTFFIAGNGTNSIYIDPGLGSITLNSNTIWVSGQTPAGNGRYSNINMLNSAGNNWETQSSAFTETLKAQITINQNNIASNTTSITNNTDNINGLIDNQTIIYSRLNMQHMKINLGFNMIGGSSLADNTTYTNFLGYSFNLGAYMYNNGYSSHFDSDGTLRLTKNYIVQLSVVFYHNYSNIKNFHSQIQIVQTSTNTIPDTTNLIGISSNGFNGNYTTQQQFCNYNTDNIPLYNSYYGNAKIIIKTLYDFTTLLGPFSLIAYVRFIQTT